MKIVLDKNDLEQLIKKSYNGVTEIKFNSENIEATLLINVDDFIQKVKTLTPVVEKEEQELKKGLMTSGKNSKRNLVHFG